MPGDVFKFGAESAQKWVDAGFIELAKVETKKEPKKAKK